MSRKKGLKIFISADMEGISGIVHGSQTGGEGAEYERGRVLMTGDVNAGIEGALSVGADEILVSDGHGGMRNIKPEHLNKAAVLARGAPKPLTQMSGIESGFDAAIFIGYHAMKGTKHAILDHTISGGTVDYVKINGFEVGETAIGAALAGYYGVPLVFVSGDLAVTKEAQTFVPKIKTVAVKEALSRTGAKCLHPEKARELIRSGVAEAVNKRTEVKPFTFKPPIELQVRYANSLMADVVEFMPLVERVDGRTIRIVLDDYIKAFTALRASIFLATTALT